MTDINYRTLRGIDGYLAAFPNALRGLEGRRLRNVVEVVHSVVCSKVGGPPRTTLPLSLTERIGAV